MPLRSGGNVPRISISPSQIDAVVAAFYKRIRAHDELGPIFFDAIGRTDVAWRAHEEKIASFWRNAALLDRSYSGNPMRVHLANEDIQPQHFPTWLLLFHETASDVLPVDSAAQLCALADRIARSLAMGIENLRQVPGTAPVLAK